MKRKNETPLHIASYNDSKDVGELLLQNGADTTIVDITYISKIFFLLSHYFKINYGHFLKINGHHFIGRENG